MCALNFGENKLNKLYVLLTAYDKTVTSVKKTTK